jgi:signal transduction histidine kinase
LGFETASVYVHGPHGWRLLDRRGPTMPWHAVLDPSLLQGTDEIAAYPDVRALPGAGIRLAALGCASLGVLPLPGGGRVLLDSGRPVPADGWIERSKPYLSLISIMAGPGWSSDRALGMYEELGAIERVFDVCRHHLVRGGGGLEELVSAARLAIRADEMFLVRVGRSATEVTASPPTTSPTRMPTGFPVRLAPQTDRVLEGPALRRAAVAVGASCPSLAGVAGRTDQDTDVLVAGWSAGPALSSMPMMVVGRALSLVRLVMGGRKEAVTCLLDRERTRLVYALHDGLLQSVTGAVLELEALRSKIEQDPARAVGAVEGSKAEIRRALADLRDILFGLSGDGEPGSPESFVQQVHDLLGRWSLPATVKVRGRLDGVPPSTLTVACFVIRESVANAAKHSATSDVSVILGRLDSELRVEIPQRTGVHALGRTLGPTRTAHGA